MTYKERYRSILAEAALPLSAWNGVLILEVIHDIDDYVITCYEISDEEGSDRTNFSKSKIQYTASGEAYFFKQGSRYYLDDFIRAGAI